MKRRGSGSKSGNFRDPDSKMMSFNPQHSFHPPLSPPDPPLCNTSVLVCSLPVFYFQFFYFSCVVWADLLCPINLVSYFPPTNLINVINCSTGTWSAYSARINLINFPVWSSTAPPIKTLPIRNRYGTGT